MHVLSTADLAQKEGLASGRPFDLTLSLQIEMASITMLRVYLRDDDRRLAENIASPIPNNSIDDGSGTYVK